MDRAAAFASLRDILASILITEAETRVVVFDANLDASSIEFSGQAVLTWQSVLRNAEYQNRMARLLVVVTKKYPVYLPLHDAIRDYCVVTGVAPPDGLLPDKRAPASAVVTNTAMPGAPELARVSQPVSNTRAWLKRVGFEADLFSNPDAIHEIMLPDFFIETPLYLELANEHLIAPVLLICGEPGAGKSALRRMLTHTQLPTNSAASVLAVEITCFCRLREAIEHNWHASLLPQFLSMVMQGAVEGVVQTLPFGKAAQLPIPQSTLENLKWLWLIYGVTANDPVHFYSVFRDVQVDMLRFNPAWKTRRLSNLLAGTSGWDQAGLRSLAALVDARPIKPDVNLTAADVALRQLVEIAAAIGLPSIHILFDFLGEPAGSFGNWDAVAARLAPIVGGVSLMDIPGVVFRFFLPSIIVQALVERLGVAGDHFQLRDLQWQEADLRRLLTQRLSTFSNGKIAEIAQLCDDELAANIESLLIRTADGIPRKLLHTLQNLIITHCLRAGDQLRLTLDDWEASQIAFDPSHIL